MEPLTIRERQVFDALVMLIDLHGYAPSVRELGAAIGLSSPSTVHRHLASLVDKGWITRGPLKSRAICIRGTA